MVLAPGEVAAIEDVARTQGLALVVLFGSVATGKDRPGSDVDLGVLATEDRPLSLSRIGELTLSFSEVLGRSVDIVDLKAADAIARFEVASHGRVVFTARPGEWARFVARTLIDHDDLAPFLPELIAGVGRAARGGA